MLNWIIDFSLRHRFLVILGTLACAVAGAVSLTRLDIDAFPDTTPVQVQINTPAPALGPGGFPHRPRRSRRRRQAPPERSDSFCGRARHSGRLG